MAKLTSFEVEPNKPKGIVINEGLNAPLVVYGKNWTDNGPKDEGEVIIFDEGKFTPKSATVADIMKFYANTGQLLPTPSDSLSGFQVGDTVLVSDEGVWSMGDRYWMQHVSQRQWTITGPKAKYSSGLHWPCEEGALPSEEYLTKIGSSASKAIEYNPWQDGSDSFIYHIIDTMVAEYGELNSKEVKQVKLDLMDCFKANGNRLHDMVGETQHWEFIVLDQDLAKEYLMDYMSDQDPEWVGGFDPRLMSEIFPDLSGAIEALHESCSHHAIGEIILSLDYGVDKLITGLVNKYGLSQILGDCCNWYDNICLEFAHEGKKYYILRRD